MELLEIEKISNETEEIIGDLIWNNISLTETLIEQPFVMSAVDSIVDKICNKNYINRDKIKVHVIDNHQVNAFALPDGHLVIYTGLIETVDDENEFSGVVCHELAHIELNHVMKKLIKEIGLSVLLSVSTGNAGGEFIKKVAKMLSSTAFDRTLEKEADLKAVEYLLKAKIDPYPFSRFMDKLSKEEDESKKYLSWISTHPESEDRASYIKERAMGSHIEYEFILSPGIWDNVTEALQSKKERKMSEDLK